MKLKITHLFFVLLFLLNFSCKKDIVLTGSIEGKVDLLTNEAGDTLSLQGIKVTLISSLSDTAYTTTDANGHYKFSDVKTGSGEIIIGELPIGQYHYFIKFVGGESTYHLPGIKLSYKSTLVPYDYQLVNDEYFIVKVKKPDILSDKYAELSIDYFYSDGMIVNGRLTVIEDSIVKIYHEYNFLNYNKVEVYGQAFGEHSKYIDTLGREIDPTLSTKFISINF